MTSPAGGREITIEQLMTLRAATEAASTWLRTEIEDRLDTLRPLLAPRRFLGEHVRSSVREDAADADRTFGELQASFRAIAGEPLRLSGRLESPLDPISGKLELHAWEYLHEASNGQETRRVTVKSPVSWVLLHATNITLSQARQMLAGGAGRSDADLRQIAVSALLMKILFDRMPGLTRLFGALRVRVDLVTAPETGRLPLVRLTSSIPSFRPADAAILSATRLSGVPIFEELVDVEATADLEDPIRAKLTQLAAGG